VIPVRLFGPSGYIDVQALIDSGSDDTIFDHELGDAVGVLWPSGPSYKIQGINGGEVEVHFKGGRYEIGGARFPGSIGFAKMPLVKAVLGQTGFFDHAFVTLDQGNNRIDIRF
jgi:hypothetical protein